jgi:predicted alpha/beta superfamily hydrolase
MKRFFLLASLLLSLCATAFAQNNQPLDRLTIKSEVLGEERVILVRTPAGYEAGKQRFPVLYLTDGDGHIAHTSATIEFLARNGRMPEMIVVGITNTDRTRDLSPTNATMTRHDGGQQEFPTSGGANNFLKFIETELIPKVEGQYRTQPFRVLAGHSFGGLFALHAFLAKTDLFNGYIAVSPTMHWDNKYPVRKAAEFFKDRKELNKTLFVTLADEGGEMKAGFNEFRELLAKQHPKGFAWDAMLMEDEDHGSVVLRSHYFGFRKVFDGWQIPQNLAAGGLNAVEEHYKKLSAKFNYAILPPEPLVNQLGYQLMGQGKMDEAIATFKSNVERYPGSANVYDSLAEGYEKMGKLDLAKPNYEKAAQIGEQTKDPNLQVFKANFARVSEALKKVAEAKGK